MKHSRNTENIENIKKENAIKNALLTIDLDFKRIQKKESFSNTYYFEKDWLANGVFSKLDEKLSLDYNIIIKANKIITSSIYDGYKQEEIEYQLTLSKDLETIHSIRRGLNKEEVQIIRDEIKKNRNKNLFKHIGMIISGLFIFAFVLAFLKQIIN